MAEIKKLPIWWLIIVTISSGLASLLYIYLSLDYYGVPYFMDAILLIGCTYSTWIFNETGKRLTALLFSIGLFIISCMLIYPWFAYQS